MTKLREQRRAQRAAKRRRQRLIIGGVSLAILAVIAFFAIRAVNTNKAAASTAATAAAAPSSTPGGMVTTASGLQYQDTVLGTGAAAKVGDTVQVDYTGWLADGTKFDSSLDRGQPLSFTIGAGQVIKGWDEGLVGMQVGGTRKLIIPPDLAYGANANGPIPANSTLTFEVQLLAINP